jgi:hypothetical protein
MKSEKKWTVGKHEAVGGLAVCAKEQLVKHLSKQMIGKLLSCENSEKTRQNEKEVQRCESSRTGERVHGWDKDHPY